MHDLKQTGAQYMAQQHTDCNQQKQGHPMDPVSCALIEFYLNSNGHLNVHVQLSIIVHTCPCRPEEDSQLIAVCVCQCLYCAHASKLPAPGTCGRVPYDLQSAWTFVFAGSGPRAASDGI